MIDGEWGRIGKGGREKRCLIEEKEIVTVGSAEEREG